MRRKPHFLFFGLGLLALGACSDSDKVTDDSGKVLWCDGGDDFDTYSIADGGGNATSGVLTGRLISMTAEDVHDPTLVGNVDFTLESTGSGGANLLGETDDYGEFGRTLGEGSWQFKSTGSRGGLNCNATFDFEVVAAKTTTICVEAACE